MRDMEPENCHVGRCEGKDRDYRVQQQSSPALIRRWPDRQSVGEMKATPLGDSASLFSSVYTMGRPWWPQMALPAGLVWVSRKQREKADLGVGERATRRARNPNVSEALIGTQLFNGGVAPAIVIRRLRALNCMRWGHGPDHGSVPGALLLLA
ncbi:hypothetical protein MAPG_09101 [Magnaporthiopsis poae ATCC 64411]|uniref:Uncharacterized protein n=1 Tax=Magnaporthiopsis poae (strain ATCC 64411 / 73-15) TaxID=644358 RepID=A0A0C4E925_MAGP6|nr:hypothetical protein MAPG_09101 [Magnaporthiopsis poae ATCC 64411]